MTPYFSVVIPTLNEEVNLPILLNSIAQNQYQELEVIISDSGSKDKTKNKAMEFKDKIKNLHFLEHSSKNVSAARNFGASHAKGEFIVFFDSDVEIEQNFLIQIKDAIQKYNLDCLTVWNRSKNNKLTGRFLLNLLNASMSLFAKIKPAANGPCIIIKRVLFEKIGGFDDTIVFGEDFDLIQKAHKLKAKFAVFKHPILYVSTRRFEKEGLFLSLYKSIRAVIYQLFLGPIRKPIFEYQMGGQYYQKNKKVS
ncbi:glycosyltransferase [Candidatus Gottesmanbacteria bacterium]|nr:glycosyltransferase [Candidatus Gottesmanbacteria bacterium]